MTGHSGHSGQTHQPPATSAMGLILARFAPPQPAVVSEPSVETGTESIQERPAVISETWDAERAAAVLAEVDALIDTALSPGGVANTHTRRNVMANERQIIRGHVEKQNPCVWTWADGLRKLLARWK